MVVSIRRLTVLFTFVVWTGLEPVRGTRCEAFQPSSAISLRLLYYSLASCYCHFAT